MRSLFLLLCVAPQAPALATGATVVLQEPSGIDDALAQEYRRASPGARRCRASAPLRDQHPQHGAGLALLRQAKHVIRNIGARGEELGRVVDELLAEEKQPKSGG